MASPTPKVLFDVCGLPSVVHVAFSARAAGLSRLVVVVSPNTRAPILAALARHGLDDAAVVTQDPANGTGHAVQMALPSLASSGGDSNSTFVVLYGDGPLYSADTLCGLVTAHEAAGADETLLTAVMNDPTGYGRVVVATDSSGQRVVHRIVEELDTDAGTRPIREVNTGIVAFRLQAATEALAAVRPDNAKGELYLTDTAAILTGAGKRVLAKICTDARETASFNSIEELAAVRARMRARILSDHMARGVDIVDPAHTYIDMEVEIGPGTTILPGCVIGRGVSIGAGCIVGPYAHLRGATVLMDRAEIGNFVEVKKSRIGVGTKAKHLTYLGDAILGDRANIGCGTITANYDGKNKHETRIGDGAFVGSGSVLIAPCELKADATTGAGAVVRGGSVVGPGEVFVGVPARRLVRAPSGQGSTRGSTPGSGPGAETAPSTDTVDPKKVDPKKVDPKKVDPTKAGKPVGDEGDRR